MAIPVSALQATGEFHVPGLSKTVSGRDVRQALTLLEAGHRAEVMAYIHSGGIVDLPAEPVMQSLKAAVLRTVNGRRVTP